MRRASVVTILVVFVLVSLAAPALACGGLIGPNGGVNLLRTSTLAAYKDGVEHYVTSFEFAGGGARFGSIIPLPGIPSKVIKGGDWTLQRLGLEVQPVQEAAFRSAVALNAAADSAQVIQEVQIDALNITILKGGGDAVGKWAEDEGFNLPPDAPEVLDFYARRSPIFMAAAFDAKEARERGFANGDGTPVHLVIPTDNPWVPLRILALGKESNELIEADVFLLTDRRPALLPQADPAKGLVLDRSEPASGSLLFDLRSDRGMKWLPAEGMWLSYLRIDALAQDLDHDLAIDASGWGVPSRVDAGLDFPPSPIPREINSTAWAWVMATALAFGTLALTNRLVASR